MQKVGFGFLLQAFGHPEYGYLWVYFKELFILASALLFPRENKVSNL